MNSLIEGLSDFRDLAGERKFIILLSLSFYICQMELI